MNNSMEQAPCFYINSTLCVGLERVRSYAFCRFNQNCGVVPSACENSYTVCGVMLRLPRTISLTRRTGTPMCRANSTCVTPNGFKNSSSNISPGWMLIRFSGNILLSLSWLQHTLLQIISRPHLPYNRVLFRFSISIF